MKLFKSLSTWFNTKERDEIKKEIPKPNIEKCYKNIYFDGKNITIVFNDGNTIMAECDKEKYQQITEYSSKNEIINILYNKEQGLLQQDLGILKGHPDFNVYGNIVSLKGINLALPDMVLASFIEILEKEALGQDTGNSYQALKLFWCKLACCPIAESREHLLTFIERYGVKLTNTGNMIGFRNIVSLSSDKKDRKLVESISALYLKVKTWKKKVSDYLIYKLEDEYDVVRTEDLVKPKFQNKNHTIIGNLEELYNNLSEHTENRYTDNHSKSYDIKIGATYKIREEDIDNNQRGSCGGLLHWTTKDSFNYESFGDTSVMVIVNPMHTCRMDTGHSGKIGSTQMFIACTTKKDENGDYIDIDDQTVVNFDDIYHNETIEDLQQVIDTMSFGPLAVESDTPDITINEVKNIVEILKNRVVYV